MSVTIQTVPAATAPSRPGRIVFPFLNVDMRSDSRRQSSSSSSRRPLPAPPSSFPSALIPSTPQTAEITSAINVPLLRTTKSCGLSRICALPTVLERFASWLSWGDILALSQTEKALRLALCSQAMKDRIFSYSIPGYADALRLRNPLIWDDSIRLDYADLGLLLNSLDTPLHLYPKHALTVLSSERLGQEQVETTRRLQFLCQAHSRVVLLLQSLVHSCTDPLPPDLEDPTIRPNKNKTQAARELKFPAPLSYFKSDPTVISAKANAKRHKGKRVTKSNSTPPSIAESGDSKRIGPSLKDQRNRSWNSEPGSIAASSSHTGGPNGRSSPRSRRLSVFGSPKKPPPLPSQVPDSLRIYSGNWRRSFYVPSPPTEDGALKPPKRRFASLNHSSESSLVSASSSDLKHHAIRIRPSSPHDLQCALERNRAPILRVFVPCATLCEDAITLCENQLIDHGLWRNMSVGDVVCNFGFVPPLNEAENGGVVIADQRRWLIFNGEGLEVFEPSTAPPISDVLSLPSPFYFKHILPANINPRFRFVFPLGPFPARYQLVQLPKTLHLPYSANGNVRVNTFAWLATIDADATPHPAASSGWRGVWIVESEGTVEGHTALQRLLNGSGTPTEFDVDLERSGEGRLWLRMHRSVYPLRTLDNLGFRTAKQQDNAKN